MKLAIERNVSIECHYITTEDGYILRLYHLPAANKNESDENTLKPIFLMHGLLCSSPVYITYPERSAGRKNAFLNCFI